MEKKVELTANKILEFNEKANADTLQLLSKLTQEDFVTFAERIEQDADHKDIYESLCFDKGRTVWLELRVEDSYLSGLLYSWLFTKSNHDQSPLHALGCSVQQIMFQKPSGYADDVKCAIKSLYEAAFGNNLNNEK